jgi:hypothetical protein
MIHEVPSGGSYADLVFNYYIKKCYFFFVFVDKTVIFVADKK